MSLHSISHTSAAYRLHNQARAGLFLLQNAWQLSLPHLHQTARSIFLLPSQGHAAEHTVFMVQHIWQITGQVQHPTMPQLTQHQLGAVWWTGNLVIPWLWEVTYHTTTHTSTYNSAWEQDQITTPTAGPDTSRYQAGLQMTSIPQKGEVWNKFVSKRTHDRYPWAVLHLHSTPVYHLWHKVVKDLSWAEPAVSPLTCCSTEVENMYYWSHKVLTIMAANPVNSTDVGKLLTSPSLFTYNAKKTWVFSAV